MSRERGQALVEAVAAMPVCIASALLLVDAGTIVRDRMVTAQAATRAAEATIVGDDVRDAALSAMPRGLRGDATVQVEDSGITVRVTSRARAARIVGRSIQLRSHVELDTAGEER